MNTERLLELKRVLASVDRDKFNMSDWVTYDGDDEDAEELMNRGVFENWCGAAACALGHACYHPPFQEQGLHFYNNDGFLEPVFEDEEGFCAAERFFEIDWDDAQYLFEPGEYSNPRDVTPQQVIEHIDRVLEGSHEC